MMMTLAHYQLVMYCFVGLVMFFLILTMGFDLGAASLLPFLAKTNDERRVVVNALGSTWAGNQIWLVILGGAIFVVWPIVYSAAFSGFYNAMVLFLWCLFLRPMAFEWRAKVHTRRWQVTMDWSLAVGSFVAALAIGLLIGNLLQGVPFHFVGDRRVIYTGTFIALFNPFALLVGIVCVLMMCCHGANYLQMTTDIIIARRAKRVSYLSAALFLVLFAVAGIWINAQFSYLWHNFFMHPFWLFAPILAFAASLLVLVLTLLNKPALAFIGSSLMGLGALLTFATSLFPVLMLSSTHLSESLTLWNASSGIYTLQAIFISALVLLPIIIAYTIFIYVKMMRKVKLSDIATQTNILY